MKIINKTNINKNIIKNYIITIPTYSRYLIIYEQTLKTLYTCNIISDTIYLFLSSNEEYIYYLESYNNILDIKYKKWLSKCTCVIGKLGLSNQRNFISSFFNEGQNIIQMDDDIKNIYKLKYNSHNIKNKKLWKLESFIHKYKQITFKKYKLKLKNTLKNKKHKLESKNNNTQKPLLLHNLENPINLHKLFIDVFNYCSNNNIYLWGVYPVENSYFMSPNITCDLRFIVGPFFGIINRHNKNLQLTINEKENTQRTLQYWKIDNKVLRLNNITIKTQYYKTKGGMQSEGKDRKKEAMKSVDFLHKKYPKLTKIYLGKKSGYPEIKLIK